MKQIRIVLIVSIALVLSCFSEKGKPKIEIRKNNVVLVKQNKAETISELATSDDFPFSLSPTYAYFSDSNYIAFIGKRKNDFEIFIFNIEIKSPKAVGGKGIIDGRTELVWSPAEPMLIFNRGEKLWLYDVKVAQVEQLTEPKEGFEDYDLSFSKDGRKVFFYRGTRFEYSFAGEKYKINLDGSGLTMVKEETPKYPPEDLRGE